MNFYGGSVVAVFVAVDVGVIVFCSGVDISVLKWLLVMVLLMLVLQLLLFMLVLMSVLLLLLMTIMKPPFIFGE